MPKTNFYFDWTGACKDPGQAIGLLRNDAKTKTFLSDFYYGTTVPSAIKLWRDSTAPPITSTPAAMLMMGTTGQLTEALTQDQTNGISTVETTGPMVIWYLRRRAGKVTKSLVIIASWPGYWLQQYNYQPPEKGWRELWPNPYQGRSYQRMYISDLIGAVLPNGEHDKAWW
jgi:hypothetical protein